MELQIGLFSCLLVDQPLYVLSDQPLGTLLAISWNNPWTNVLQKSLKKGLPHSHNPKWSTNIVLPNFIPESSYQDSLSTAHTSQCQHISTENPLSVIWEFIHQNLCHTFSIILLVLKWPCDSPPCNFLRTSNTFPWHNFLQDGRTTHWIPDSMQYSIQRVL